MSNLQSPIRSKVVLVSGTNLFALASQYLGDATQWNRIAKLNGLTDPMIVATVSILIPTVNPALANGGILGL